MAPLLTQTDVSVLARLPSVLMHPSPYLASASGVVSRCAQWSGVTVCAVTVCDSRVRFATCTWRCLKTAGAGDEQGLVFEKRQERRC